MNCITDRPSQPEGPLKPIETFKDRCRLQWSQPKDLGGLPLDHYLVEACDVTSKQEDDWYKVCVCVLLTNDVERER